MISYFQNAVQQHEIAQYTAATADRDLFQQHLCQWVPDTDLEQAYGESVVIAPYCGAPNNNPFTGLLNGPPDLPTIDYFIAKGYKVGYEQPLEAVAASNPASLNLIPGGLAAQVGITQAQIAEIAALGAVSATSSGVMLASRIVPRLKFTVFPTTKSRANIRNANIRKVVKNVTDAQDTDIVDAATRAIRLFGAVSIVLEIITTVISVVFAVLDAEAQKNEIDTLNADLANAKNNPPDLAGFVNDSTGTGMDKLTSVFLEMTLPEFESIAPLPLPGPTDPQFVTNSASVTNQVGAITFQDQNSRVWTATPYSQNWIVMTGFDKNHNPLVRFSNNMTFMGPDSSGNRTAYKGWINSGNFMVAKLLPNTDDIICDAGPNGLYQGDTTKCAGFTPDHLSMYDANGNPMSVTMTQGVVYDSPSPANAAFTAGVGGSVTVKAHGIPAPDFNVVDTTPPGLTFSNSTATPGERSVQLNISSTMSPQSFTFNLLFSNGASSISVPFTVNIDTVVHITSPTTFNMTYGVPVNFVVTATGSPVHFDFSKGPQIPSGVSITDHGDGTAGITGTPLGGKLFDGQCLAPPCIVRAFNEISSDSAPLVVNVFTPPSPSFTSPGQVTFRAGEYNEFVVKIDGGLTPGGVNVYQAMDACPLSKPSWLVESQRPNGDLVLSGTPPFLLNNQTLDMKFIAPLVGAGLQAFGCQFPSYTLTLTLASFPNFPSTQYLITQPGALVPANNFQMGNGLNQISFLGNLPAGVNFNSVSDAFSFSGTVSVTAAPGDYPLQINASIISNNNTGAEQFHFVVAQAPVDDGFKTFNLVINQPANVLINPKGFPKNAVGGLPAMTTTLGSNAVPAGMQQQPGPMDGSIQITGTPTQLGSYFAILVASNGVAPDLIEGIHIRVINPGDINADGHVDCSDVSMVKTALNAKLGLAGYSNLADVNGDGVINAQDLALVAKYLTQGTKCQ